MQKLRMKAMMQLPKILRMRKTMATNLKPVI